MTWIKTETTIKQSIDVGCKILFRLQSLSALTVTTSLKLKIIWEYKFKETQMLVVNN